MMEELKEGYIIDFVSGLQVKETPEEVDAVQPFAKILVNDYGYPKENIQTRPQYRVKVRPSDTKRNIPLILPFSIIKTIVKIRFISLLSVKRKIEKMGKAN